MACLVTIPGCTVAHVLGPDTNPVVLGQGTLEIFDSDTTSLEGPPATSPIAPGLRTAASSQKPPLTLTVGTAAFPLSSSTTFFTDAGDKHHYYFAPELGPGISGSAPGTGPGEMGAGKGGYVRVTLPASARVGTVDGDVGERRQEVFEHLLIDRGLLQEGEDRNLNWGSVKATIF